MEVYKRLAEISCEEEAFSKNGFGAGTEEIEASSFSALYLVLLMTNSTK